MKQIFTCLVVLSIAVSAHASEAAHASQFNDMMFRFINLAVMVAILYKVLAKPLRDYLASRSDTIKKALDEARIVREEAEKKLKEYQVKMEQLNADAKALRDSLIDEGNKEKEKIVSEANKATQRIKEQARFAAEQEIKKARIALKEETANLVAEMAEDILKKEIKDSDQERLIKEYLTTAGGIH